MFHHCRIGLIPTAGLLVFILAACQPATLLTSTLLPSASPAPTIAPVTPAEAVNPNVSLEGVSFRDDLEAPDWIGIIRPRGDTGGLPEHIYLASRHYQGLGIEAQIFIFQAADFEEAEALREFLQERPATRDPGATIPLLPSNANIIGGFEQTFAAQIAYMDFQNGTGVRFLTDYQFAPTLIANTTIFYTFQGLTNDGRFYVSVLLPVQHPSLPADFDNNFDVPGFDPNTNTYVGDFPAYVEGVLQMLNEADLDSFDPGLDQLDRIVRSLRVEPLYPLAAAFTPTPNLPTPTAEMPVTPAAPAAAPNVDSDGITFTLDSRVSPTWAMERVPDEEPYNPGGVTPRHLRFDFPGYAIAGRAQEAHFFIIPTYGLDERLNTFYLLRIEQLRQFLQARPSRVGLASDPTGGIPHLPGGDTYGLVEFFHAEIAYLDFQNGTGVRYLAAYSGDITPVTNANLLYSFQGLTADGKYVISVYLPITHPGLPDERSDVPGVDDYYTFAQNFPTYLDGIVELLDEAEATSFEPDLSLLDMLVQSIRVAPEEEF